jgi:hypothetical protein
MADNAPTPPPLDSVTPDATGGVIPYKNPCALAAYYMGVFSVLPLFGFFLSIAALICGIIGLKYRKRHPCARGAAHAWIGVVAGGLLFPVHLVLTIALISAMVMA